MADERSVDPVRGKTVRWTFTEGPFGRASYEHTFHEEGGVTWRVLEGPAQGKSAREKEYSSVRVARDVQVVSYLAASGYTLTVVMNLVDGSMVGFASNQREWYVLRGTVEVPA